MHPTLACHSPGRDGFALRGDRPRPRGTWRTIAALVATAWLVHTARADAAPSSASGPALRAARPIATRAWESVDPSAAAGPVNSHVIYLHRCVGSDCTVVQGTTNATTRPVHSSLGHGVLGPFSHGDATWNTVVQCMQEVYAPFNVLVTETDPGSAPHFEILIGGRPEEIGLPAGVGGISPFSCMPYIPNSVVFVFDVWGNDAEEICATAAQELAHSFALDHCVDPSDPMTYFRYDGRRHYTNAQVQCGSDCDKNHRSPFGEVCTGPDFQSHACACGGGAQTQNSVQVISALFGDGTAIPPSVKIVSPQTGDTVAPGFAVSAEITDDVAVSSAELRVDGTLIASLSSAPYVFTGPAALADGTHMIEVAGYDNMGAPSRARSQVIVGPGCASAADCPDASNACIAGRCVTGPGASGGLGQSCQAATDCASWQCASDNGARYCVETCKPGQCPSGFGCRDDGMGGGVCWPGFSDSTAGCAAGGGSGSPLGAAGLGLVLASVRWRRRRRRASRD